MAYEKAEAQAGESRGAALRAQAIESGLRFADAFPQNVETPAVLTRAAKALFDAGDRFRAEAVAQRVLALGSRADAGQQVVAWTVLAHTYFDEGRFADAEKAYAELAQRLPAGDPQRAEANERLAASVYRQAEARQASGDVSGAVHEYLRVASVAPGSPASAKAEYDAAALLINAGRWDEAAAVLQRFRANYPGHELQPEATRKLAAAYLEAGHWHEAAAELEQVAVSDAESADVRRSALWQAAELYATSDDPTAARRAYAAYVQRFPAPLEPAIEARQQLVNLAVAAGDAGSRKRWLEELVAAAGVEILRAIRLLAAQASLELAQPLDEAARSIRLAVPLDRALAAKKAAMEQALAAYSRAAGYGVAEVATAATYAMADLYRDLGRALLASERPAGLTPDEAEQYDLLLEEQAYPFEEKAIAIHQGNARRAAQGVYDTWVGRSFAALAEMKPARYDRRKSLPAPRTRRRRCPRSRRGSSPPRQRCGPRTPSPRRGRPRLCWRSTDQCGGAQSARRRAPSARDVHRCTRRVRAGDHGSAGLRQSAAQSRRAARPVPGRPFSGACALREVPAVDGRCRRRRRTLARRASHAARTGPAHRGGDAMMLRMHALAALLLVAPITVLATDRLQLDSTAITGNRELPKVMSIVP